MSAAERRPPKFLAGILLSLFNPKAYAVTAALFSGFVLIDARPFLDAGLKIAVLALVTFLIDIAWLSVGAALTQHFRDPRRNRAINVGFAALLILAVAATLLI
jgi:threonine/homoserine/homoserine lactone efflux protein